MNEKSGFPGKVGASLCEPMAKKTKLRKEGREEAGFKLRNLRSISVVDQEAFLLHLSHFVKEVKPDACS